MPASFVRTFFSLRMLVTLLTGFASGLPLLLTGSTLQAWMTDAQVDISTLGYFSLVGLPYTLKFLWAPLFDRYSLPFLGRRRGWLLIVQIVLALAVLLLGATDPSTQLERTAVLAILVTFFSASQDILIDSYRREQLPDAELGLGASVYTFGYRLAMLFAGAFALFLADRVSWQTVYYIMTGTFAACILVTLIAPEAKAAVATPRSLRDAIVDPLVEFFRRPKALVILAFILLYKIGDNMAAALVIKYIKDLGYTNTDLATIQKIVGMIALVVGGLLGGSLMLWLGTYRSLFWFGILQSVSTVGFSALYSVEHTKTALAIVIAFENFCAGLGTAAYAGFMASLTDRRFTATQYALLTSLMGVSRVIFSAPAGDLVKLFGWQNYYLFCALLAIPGLLLLPVFRPLLALKPLRTADAPEASA